LVNLFEYAYIIHPRIGHEGPKGVQKYSSILSSISVLGGGGWSTPRLGHFIPGKETRYPLYRRLGEIQAGLDVLTASGFTLERGGSSLVGRGLASYNRPDHD